MNVGVFIDGAAGTTGLEIRDRLSARIDVTLIAIAEAHRKNPVARAEALNDADIVILCLPDDAAREAVTLIRNVRTRVIDASTAHRVAQGWTYGFPELDPYQSERIAASNRVTNPGCYPTGFLGLIRPLVRAGLIPADYPLTVNAVSGYSGGGKAMIAEYESAAPASAARPYALTLAHKHVPEMQRHAELDHPPVFAPSVVNTYRGMIVEVPLPLHVFASRPSPDDCASVLRAAYDGSRIVVVGNGDLAAVHIEDDAGTDRLTLRVCGNVAIGQARLVATLDNLGKGAAGAAVQNLNVMAGLDPTAGLVL